LISILIRAIIGLQWKCFHHLHYTANARFLDVIDITLEDNAVWQVTGTSLIHSLTISGDSSVIIPEGVTLTVNGIDYSGCTMTAGSY